MKAIDLVPLDQLKVVYFDVDGVLSIPRYPLGKNGQMIAFAESPKWDKFVYDNINAYDECFAPTAVIEWMKKLKEANIIMHGLSQSNAREIPSKMKFLKTYYDEYLTDRVIVEHSEDKITHMLNEQKEHGYDPFEMALVEDNHYALFNASEKGFRGIHISWFLDA